MATPVSNPSSEPLRPCLAFRVGVVGHRWDRMSLGSQARVTSDARDALEAIRIAVEGIGRRGDRGGYSAAPAHFSLVSALAEGADRILADEAVSLGYALDVILPFDEAEYRTDFLKPRRDASTPYHRPEDSITHFDRLLGLAGPRVLTMDGPTGGHAPASRPFDAYVPGGRAVLDNCDLLVAVWDGQPGRGIGGTPWLIAHARRAGIPVVRIDSRGQTPGPWLEDMGHRDQADQLDEGRALGFSRLAARVEELLLPGTARERQLAEEFFGETLRGSGDGVFRRLVKRHRRRTFLPPLSALQLLWFQIRARWARRRGQAGGAVDWEVGWATPGGPPEAPSMTAGPGDDSGKPAGSLRPDTIRELSGIFGPRFRFADRLAISYAERHRGSVAWVFSLSWLAVLGAVVTFGFHLAGREWTSTGMAAFVLLVLMAALGLVARGTRRRYHEKWLNYRQLAERTRHLIVLWLTAKGHPDARVPSGLPPDDRRRSWVSWLLRAVQREVGLCRGDMSTRRVGEAHWLLRCWLLPEQTNYARHAVGDAQGVERALHRWSIRLLRVALLFAFAEVSLAALVLAGVPIAPGKAIPWLLLAVAVVAPAWASALHGFGGQADLTGSALRSAHLAERLAEIKWSVQILEGGAGGQALTSETLGTVVLDAVAALEHDLLTWRTTFEGKPLQEA